MNSKTPRPNLLLIMTDQQRFDTLSGHGGQACTPNIDGLAASGIDLRMHYSQSPVCMPSRCSIFSGRYPHTHRILENNSKLGQNEAHLFKVLKQAGYWLAYHGKNHMLYDEEVMLNFDHCSDPCQIIDESEAYAEMRQLIQEAQRRLDQVGAYASAAFHDLPDHLTNTGIITGHSIGSLMEAPVDSPWCMVTSFNDPHVPHLAPRRFAALHPEDQMRIPELPVGDIFAGKPARMRIKHRAQGSDKATDEDKRRYLSAYYSMCSFVDEQVGNILAVLRQRPDADRTIVVFTSDHGDFAWHHGLCKKDLALYEDLLHVPSIIHWPERLCHQVVENTYTEHVDWMPTLLELMEVEIPFGCQGKSFVPLLRGETDHHRDETHAEACYPWMQNPYDSYDAFLSAWESDQATGGPLAGTALYNVPGDFTKGMRNLNFSYNWYWNGFEELYDLRKDPDEHHNLASSSEYAETVLNMRSQLMEWLVRSADPRNPHTERKQKAALNAWNELPVPAL